MITFAGHLRACTRLLVLLVWLLLLTVSWLLPLAVGVFSRRAKAKLRVRQMAAWSRVSLRLMGVRVTREGPPPRAPFFLVSNHLSYLDVLALWSQVDTYFLAKLELGSWPLLGPLIRAAGTLFVDRNRARGVLPAIEAVQRTLDLGCGVLVFPEGTSSSGAALLPLRTNFFEVPVRSGYPVHVACLHYASGDPRHPSREHVAWWGDMGFPDHFYRLLSIRRIDARVRFAAEPVAGDDRKRLAADVAAAMEAIFEPLPDDGDPVVEGAA